MIEMEAIGSVDVGKLPKICILCLALFCSRHKQCCSVESNLSVSMSVCAVCMVPSEKKCSVCSAVYYCSREHQKQDWKTHKLICVPYKVVENEEIGRHLVCTRKINVNEEILRESPLVSGPFQSTPPVCLGCYNVLTELSHVECPKCGWPMCSLECAKSAQHYPECHITTKFRGAKVKIQTFQMTHPSYQSLTVLRCLYLKNEQPKKWEKLLKLESHCDQRKATEKYEQDRQAIAQFIARFFKYSEFSEQDILKIIGIINVNGHEVPLANNDFVSIYDKISFLEHNCRANCSKSFSSTGEIVIRSARPIEPGEHISICYTDPLWGTATRRTHLMETKYFECNCQRCQDPTEKDTHFSSIKCSSSGCKGFFIPTDPLNSNKTDWKCTLCNIKKSANEIGELITKASNRLATIDKTNMDSCQKFITDFSNYFHPNHYLITDAKLSVTQILDTVITKLSDKNLDLKMQYCRQLNQLVSKLVPAENRCRGLLLFGLHAALAEYGRRKANSGEMDHADLKNNLLECKEILKESYQLIRYEPEILPEGQIALQAKKNLKDIEKILQTLHSNMGDAPL